MDVLDPQVVNLAKAIRQVETGGNPKAKGASGEFGAYQFMPETWNKTATKYGVNTPLEKSSLEEQNKVAYHQIKEWKDAGYKPDQIASMWNSGKPEWQGNVGVNSKGVKYNVPKYVNSVYGAYQKIKEGGEAGIDPNNPSSVGNQTEQPKQGIVKNVFNALTQSEQNLGKDIGRGILGGDKFQQGLVSQYEDNAKKLADLASKQTDPELKQKYLDMSKGMYEDGKKAGEDFKGRTWEQIAGDVAGTALDIGTTVSGLGAVSAVGKGGKALSAGQKIAKGATTGLKYGTAYGLTQGLQENKDLGGVIKSGATSGLLGGLTGGAISGAGEAVNKLAEFLPQRFVKGVMGKGISNESIDYALTKKLGNPSKMFNESQSSLQSIGNGIGEILKKPEYKTQRITAQEVLPYIMADFPNAGLNPETIVKKLIDVAPNEQDLVLKMLNQGLDLEELQKLKSAIGSNTYKTVFDTPTTKAGKDIANSFYQFAKNYIQKEAPETTPLMTQYQLEKGLRDALAKVVRNKERSKIFNLRDLMAIIAGMSTAGPMGAMGAYAGEKFINSPTANLKTAGLISKLANNKALEKTGILTNLMASKSIGASQ